MTKVKPEEVEDWFQNSNVDNEPEPEVKSKLATKKKLKKVEVSPEIDIEQAMKGIDTEMDIDLTNLNGKKKQPTKREQKREEVKDSAINDFLKAFIGDMGDRFSEGIVSKIEMGVSAVTPNMPLTEVERDSLKMDISLIMCSPEILEKITKLPMWVGIILLVITIIFIIVTRLFTPKKEEIPVIIDEDQKVINKRVYHDPPGVKKNQKKKVNKNKRSKKK